jgi:group II intron reverse transcriptase/maturase
MINMTENIELLCSQENLKDAWLNIAAKKSAPGIDNISVETFSRNVEVNLSRLSSSICNKTYTPQPLIVFPKEKKDHSFREITIPTISDKIVAKTIADFEVRRFNSLLEPQSYAYRPHKSATKAVKVVEDAIHKSNVNYVARIDITSFFDSLDHAIMKNMLTQYGNPQTIVDIIMLFATNKRFDGVQLITPEAGIPQGSPIAPVISNLYLDYFDKVMNNNQISFLRYADDIIIFAEDADHVGNAMNLAISTLKSISLDISIDKTRIYEVAKGFVFLGFLFSNNGKIPCREAENNLSAKLATPKYDDETDEEYEKRIKSVIRGWKNYYYFDNEDAKKNVEDIKVKKDDLPNNEIEKVELSTVTENPVLSVHDKENKVESIYEEEKVPTELISEIEEMIHLELEQEAIRKIRFLLSGEYELDDTLFKSMNAKIADLYEKQGLFGAADRCRKIAGNKKIKNRYKQKDELIYGTENVEKWMELFSSDSYIYRQYVDRVGRMGYKPASKKLNTTYLKDHWLGKHTLAIPIFDKYNDVHFAVMDFDISRKQLDTLKKDEICALKQRLLDDARGVLDIAFKAGVKGLIEDSGYKGYHIWFFFYKRIPAKLAKDFLQALNRVAGNSPEGTHRELFPASDFLKKDQLNSRIKLPLGLHRLTGKYSQFLKPDGQVSDNGILALSSDVFFNRCIDLKKAMRGWDEYSSPENNNIPNHQTSPVTEKSDIEHLFKSCAVLQAIKQKAESTKNISHYERVVLRGILAPMGNEGRLAIHDIMNKCNNYNKSLTDKMVAESHSKSMGCYRIKEILSYMVRKIDCNCKFRKTKNDYANPLRHLNKNRKSAKIQQKKISDNITKIEKSQKTPPPIPSTLEESTEQIDALRRTDLYNNKITPTSNSKNLFLIHIAIGPLKFDIKLYK